MPVLIAIVLGLGVLMLAPTPLTRAAEPLPECRYDDLPTRYTAYRAWRVTLLDTIYKLPRTYAPRHLVSTAEAGLDGGHRVRPLVIDDLRAMARAARAADAPLYVLSGYRSYQRQKELFRAEVERYGREQALKQVARPGHSEHQLGTTLDFRSATSTRMPWNYRNWANTPAGGWLAANAHRFGFVMSYPKGRASVTCYMYEPWHYRYVGRELAADIHASGLTLRQYLWRHYETAR